MLRKFGLVVILLAAPPLVAAIFYVGTKYFLAAASRRIDEATLDYITLAETAFFYFGAFLEVRSRWSLHTSDL